MKKIFVFCALFLSVSFVLAEEASCPHHAEHQKQVDEQGDRVMGFTRDKATHHFQLKKDGGVILAEAIDASDMESIGNIRKHFVEIATEFSRGEFSKPKEIHHRVPPGVDEMTEHRDAITYRFSELSKGGEIRIQTENEEALKAIHAFLRFQIQDHRTGDPLTVQ